MKSLLWLFCGRWSAPCFRAWCQCCVSRNWQTTGTKLLPERQFDRIAEQGDEVLQATPGRLFP